MAAVVLDQAAQRLDLRWTIDDPVSLTALITGGAAWAGTYTVESPSAHESQPIQLDPGQAILVRNPTAMDAAGTWQLAVAVDWYEAPILDSAA